MSASARLNRRLTRLAVGRHLQHRAVRRRLTLLYGGLFLLSGAALMAITYVLLVNAGFVFTLQSGVGADASATRFATATTAGTPLPGTTTHPSPSTLVRWAAVARCMRRRGIAAFPNPTNSVPRNLAGLREVSDRDGAILAIPATVDTRSPAFTRASTDCGFMPDYAGGSPADTRGRTHARAQLLIQAGIALAGMSLLSLGLGWLVAGRVLAPLEDSYRAQRQFVANASHELRAPLTRQRALIQVALADPGAGAAALRAAHERVLASEQDLEQLIDGLLTLTRGQAGLERREPIDLAQLAGEAMIARDSQLRSGGLEVRATLAPAPTAGDPRLVDGLIANLIDNAIRHNTAGGHLEVRTGTRDRRAFVAITNSGQAVPPEEIDRLLKPFQRLSAARTDHTGGHGLGLSIVQAIADAHHAQLSARARPEGGLAVEVSFPPAGGSPRGLRRAARFRPARRSGRRTAESS